MNITSIVRIVSFATSILWIILLHSTLPVDDTAVSFSWNKFLIDSEDQMGVINIQAIMWVCFFICLSEILIKHLEIKDEQNAINNFDLYTNPHYVNIESKGQNFQVNLNPDEALKPELLSAIYFAKKYDLDTKTIIGKMFKNITYQFNATNEVSDVYNVVTTDMDISLHNVDLKYTFLKYLAWLIPTLGFIGTVIGIAVALGQAATMESGDPEMLKTVIPMLSSAFYTTLLALLLSAIVMILLQVIQAKDERTVTQAGDFCLENIIVNLKPRKNT